MEKKAKQIPATAAAATENPGPLKLLTSNEKEKHAVHSFK